MKDVSFVSKKSWLESVFLLEIVRGMALTWSRLFAKPITRQYPTEKRQPFLGFRGQNALARDEETGESRCVACMRCSTACPSRCIRVSFHEAEDGSGRRVVDSFTLDATRCIFCGYCAEVCPVNAIVLTEVYEYTVYDRRENFFNRERLLDNWDRFITESGQKPGEYRNPFWQALGLDRKLLPRGRRKTVPAAWTPKGQIVGKGAFANQLTSAQGQGRGPQ